MDLIDPGIESQRIDKWLWHARIVRTRTLAATLANSGKIRLDSRRVTRASQTVRAGNIVLAPQGDHIRCLKIVGFAKRRVPAAQSTQLYEDLAPIEARSKSTSDISKSTSAIKSGMRESGSGRPTKRDRRLIEQLQNKHG
ncbi:MAG: RNA-binding S4 domain-containing protein [Rhizobiales bacterium]|nr:RNA-binding S4 domain-containing protein [Hyphomicrobiales bacterium]